MGYPLNFDLDSEGVRFISSIVIDTEVFAIILFYSFRPEMSVDYLPNENEQGTLTDDEIQKAEECSEYDKVNRILRIILYLTLFRIRN